MEFKTITSLVTSSGGYVDDLSTLLESGSYSRVHRGRGQCSLMLKDAKAAVVDKIFAWDAGVRFETEYADGFRELTWEGPVTNAKPTADGKYEVLGNDLSIYWPFTDATSRVYASRDVARLTETFLQKNLAYNSDALPVFETFDAGSLDDIDGREGVFVQDIIAGFPGLSYCFVGKTLFLFGFGNSNNDIKNLDFEFLASVPVVEQIGVLYATRVMVRGSGVTGYAEIPGVNRLTRRFNQPEIKIQSVADAAAQEYLNQVSQKFYVNLEEDIALNTSRMEYRLNELICGAFVDVSTKFANTAFSDRFILDRMTVDAVQNNVSVGLTPYGRVEAS